MGVAQNEGSPIESDLKLFFGVSRPLVGQLCEGIELPPPSSRFKQYFPGLCRDPNFEKNDMFTNEGKVLTVLLCTRPKAECIIMH